mgnify:CR=1 FL=1
MDMNDITASVYTLPSDHSLEEIFQAFSKYLTEQNLSGSTIVSYLFGVRVFFKRYQELLPDNLHLYKAWLLEHYEPQTVNSRIRALNAFLRFCKKGDELHLKALRIQQKAYLDHVISEGDYEYLIRRLKEDGEFTFYFIVRFLAATGVRVSELLQIKAEHVQIGYFDLYSKGGKMRRVYFPESLRREVLPWLEQTGKKTGFLFTNHRGEPITARGVHSQLKALARRYEIPENTVYPHSFRHRFAINFLDKFNDISLLADLLGHDSVETTKIYLTKSSEEQKELIDSIVTW